MRSINCLRMVAAVAVVALCSIRRADAQAAFHVGGVKLKPISFPFMEPGELFNGAQKNQTEPLAEFDWDSTFESDVEEISQQADDAGVVQISDELLVPPAITPEVSGEAVIMDAPSSADDDCSEEEECKRRSFWQMADRPYSTYRTQQENLTWLPGSGDDFGIVNWSSDPYLAHDEDGGFSFASNIHWLSGPTSVPLQSRVFDFAWAYQTRGNLSPSFSYDLSASVGVYSDFEASAREGVRFPAHAVGMFHLSNDVDFVFGIDYLDRDDISLLPVVGLSLHGLALDGLRLDLVFPRPRVEYTFSDEHRMYVGGELGGGSWDVELQGVAQTVATYRDYRVVVGFESADEDGSLSAWEFGYVFDRALEFRGLNRDTGFGDAFMINIVTRH